MKYKFRFLFLCILIMLGGCNSNQAQWKSFQDKHVKQPEAVNWSEEERMLFQSYLTPNQESSFDDELLSQMMEQTPVTSFTAEDAKADVEILFQLLQESYAGYQYFGGDQVFLPLKQEILLAVEQSANIAINFDTILQEALSKFIRDGHFMIDNAQLSTPKFIYYDIAHEFVSDQVSFTSDILQLSPTIAQSGKIIYRLTAMDADDTKLPHKLMINGKEETLSWTKMKLANMKQDIAFEQQEVNSIQIWTSRHFFEDSAEDDLQQLANAGEAYQNKSAFIIDLRGHHGGNSSYAMTWLANYLGEQIELKGMAAQRFSKPLAYYAYHSTGEYRYPKEIADFFQEQRSWWMSSQIDGKTRTQTNSIFVLMDKTTASSAESFIQALRSLPNVYLVGSNTKGGSAFGNVCYFFYLPHTKIKVGFGTMMQFMQTMELTEGVGIVPDLYVEPEEALDTVLALIRRYRLNIK